MQNFRIKRTRGPAHLPSHVRDIHLMATMSCKPSGPATVLTDPAFRMLSGYGISSRAVGCVFHVLTTDAATAPLFRYHPAFSVGLFFASSLASHDCLNSITCLLKFKVWLLMLFHLLGLLPTRDALMHIVFNWGLVPDSYDRAVSYSLVLCSVIQSFVSRWPHQLRTMTKLGKVPL
ncbi:putative WD repeat-containing protein C3H5.08c [Fusarium oxysporum f. sp. albedinis]|nr:putative WD repeat-containing protein C3H5.08c [Fusarium oxysporum f. sp. albedinis]